jgi:hypothetical protein
MTGTDTVRDVHQLDVPSCPTVSDLYCSRLPALRGNVNIA